MMMISKINNTLCQRKSDPKLFYLANCFLIYYLGWLPNIHGIKIKNYHSLHDLGVSNYRNKNYCVEGKERVPK